MITKILVKSFKSLESVEIDLGLVNVFIGANGSGKSNFIEAVGVLSAAAEGKVNDQVLLQRGVRPGVPMLYKSAFPPRPGERQPSHIFFGAHSPSSRYEVSLNNPLKDPSPAWRFKTELWECGQEKIVGRSPAKADNPNLEQGLAALKAVERRPDDPALALLKALQGYVVFTPTTSVLRGIAPETQPRKPVGLSGGQLPDAIQDLTRARDEHAERVCRETLELIDWAGSFAAAPATSIPLSPSAAASSRVIKFVDRYMQEGRNVLSGYDASEGALYVLFLAVLAAHASSPLFCAIDNADHGLNPQLLRSLMKRLCGWYLNAPVERQLLLTTHNLLVLDGLMLQDDRVRLFCVERNNVGRTIISRIVISDQIVARAREVAVAGGD